MTLERKHLLPYGNYGIRVLLGSTLRDLTAISLDSEYCFVTAHLGSRKKQMAGIESVKPVLHPLSDLTKEIECNSEPYRFIPIKWLEKEGYFGNDILRGMIINQYINIHTLPFCIVQKLHEWHFDTEELIEKGLAIDINTLQR